MSLLTIIDQVPLYTTIEEALIWGTQYNITGYHTHVHNGVTGYMPGENHEQITSALAGGIINFLTPQQLAQGQFVVTPETAQAYVSQQEAQTLNATQPPVVQPAAQPVVQPIADPVIEPKVEQTVAPKTNTPTRNTQTSRY
jgi:hypothetical protein